MSSLSYSSWPLQSRGFCCSWGCTLALGLWWLLTVPDLGCSPWLLHAFKTSTTWVTLKHYQLKLLIWDVTVAHSFWILTSINFPVKVSLYDAGLMLILVDSLAPTNQNHKFLLQNTRWSQQSLYFPLKLPRPGLNTHLPRSHRQATDLWTLNGFSMKSPDATTILVKTIVKSVIAMSYNRVPISLLMMVPIALMKALWSKATWADRTGGDIFSCEIPSSQIALTCVKLIENTEWPGQCLRVEKNKPWGR